MPYLLKGQTIGKKILKIHLVTEEKTIPNPHQYLLRYGILYLIYIPLPFYLLYLINNLSQSHILQITIIIFIPLYYLIIFIKIIKRKKLIYEKISKTKAQFHTKMNSAFKIPKHRIFLLKTPIINMR